jgi:hypothetical protein
MTCVSRAQTNDTLNLSLLSFEQKEEAVKSNRVTVLQKLSVKSPHIAYRFKLTDANGNMQNQTKLSPENEAMILNKMLILYDKNHNRKIDPGEYDLMNNVRKTPSAYGMDLNSMSSEELKTKNQEYTKKYIHNIKDRTETRRVIDNYGSDVVGKYDLDKDGILNADECRIFRSSLNLLEVSK